MTPESPATVEHLIERLSQHRVDLTTTLEMMQGYAQQVDTAAHELENPQAVKEYLTYFSTLFLAMLHSILVKGAEYSPVSAYLAIGCVAGIIGSNAVFIIRFAFLFIKA